MSSSTSALSAGLQPLYNEGLLPSSLQTATLNGASSGQLNQLANTSSALQEVGTLLGFGTSSTDSATLSPTAADTLSNSSTSTSTDPLTAAVDNALTYKINAAVDQFAPPSSVTTGSQINLLG
jgi:hypothetical protein